MYDLKELRHNLNITNQEFSKSLGMPPSRVSEYVTGKRRMSLDAAYKVMKAYDVIASIDFKTKAWKFTPC